MSREYERRAAVIESFRAGHCAKDIIAWFNYPKTVVYDLKKAWEAADHRNEFASLSLLEGASIFGNGLACYHSDWQKAP